MEPTGIIVNGVAVPKSIEAKGADAIDKYVADNSKAPKPKKSKKEEG